MKLLIVISLILFCFLSVVSLPTEINQFDRKTKWSAYQGKMNWEVARVKCESLGMKLPNRKELTKAYKEKVTESWKEADYFSGYAFWSSEEYSDDLAYFLHVGYGDISYTEKSSDDKHVRCIR